METIRELTGATENDWTGTSTGDILGWAGEIFETAVASTVLLPHVLRYDSPRSVHVPFTSRQASTWVTGATDAASSGSTAYDMDDITLAPVKSRTLLQVNREAIDIATWSVEADVRKRLAHRIALKLDEICWEGMDDAVLSSSKYQVAGSGVDTGTNVSVGTALSVDNIVDAIDGISANNYEANTIILRSEHHADLLKESTFINAAEHGDATVLRSGKIANFLGCNVYVSNNIPEDSGSLTLSFCFDDTGAIAANIPQEMELDSHLYWRTDNLEFTAAVRGIAAQMDENAAACLYGSA